LTCTEYFGAALGVGASLDLSWMGFSGGASTAFTTEVSAAIVYNCDKEIHSNLAGPKRKAKHFQKHAKGAS
jgi:hypothetical protein